ncbi:allergin-1 isoform X6 [Mauremys reevesii]|uniref:allergin-1 isoform X6 n=1 Tax=Mauremys reevesii TaxID=260615 RepID=UPI00193FAD72|nr:allergin-1 isoform X6 [Mauremys reevesii]
MGGGKWSNPAPARAVQLAPRCAAVQSTQESQKSNETDNEQLSNPEFGSLQKSLEVGIGQNVTLSCQSTSGFLPINYTFFRGSQNLWPTIPKTDRNPALFNLTISSASDLGEYKCKAVNRISNSAKYSESLNFTLLDPVSKPVLTTTTSQVRIGQNVTLSCHSENGSSPINYVFFKGRKTMLSKISMQGKAAAVLNVTINSSSDLGDYKCKAENNIPNNTKYSNSLNFTLAGKLKSTGSSTGFVSTDKATGSETYATYTEIEYAKSEEVEYANILIRKEEEDRKVNKRADTTVVYSEVIVRDGTQQAETGICHHISAACALARLSTKENLSNLLKISILPGDQIL